MLVRIKFMSNSVAWKEGVEGVGRNVEDGVRRESERVDAYVRKLTEINKAKAAGTKRELNAQSLTMVWNVLE